MAKPTTSSPLSNPSHSTLHNFHADVMMFGATGDGVTDDTAAFTAAEAAIASGDRIFVPDGTYVVGDWTPTKRFTLIGAGQGTILKAKTAATQVLLLEGLTHCTFRDLTFDGRSNASKGVVIKGSATLGSQSHLFDGCKFQNCSTGVHVATGTTTQADKNTYLGCWWEFNTTGLHIDSVNAQEQLMLGCVIDNSTTAVRVTNGTLVWIGGQVQTASSAGILIDGSTIPFINLRDVHMEGETNSIDGSSNWPFRGVFLENCILQGATTTVKMGVASSVLVAIGTSFTTGNINATADGCVLDDKWCVFNSGAAWNPTGLNCVRWQQAIGTGLQINGPTTAAGQIRFGGTGAAAMDVNLYRTLADTLKTDDSLEVGGPYIYMSQNGAHISLTEDGINDVAAAGANSGRIYVRDNGSGKTQLCVRFATGAVQVIATEP